MVQLKSIKNLSSFRTLYVEVYHRENDKYIETLGVSVHYMLRFILKAPTPNDKTPLVSVHYMLRFITAVFGPRLL